MANSVAIPQDIIDNVIAAVGKDKDLLKRCALVSSSFLLPSRKQLFSKIYLTSSQASQRLHPFLVQNPVIQSFVRSITILENWYEASEQLNCTSLLAILRLPFCCLESFSIIFTNPWSWNSFSSELKDALSNIIHLSTLKTLYLDKLANVPITLFLGIVHLTKLKLGSISHDDFDGEQSSSLTPAASKGVATTASHTVIDRCVWCLRIPLAVRSGMRFPTSAYLSLIEDMEGPTEPIFLPFMCRLRFFEIGIITIMHDFDILSFLMRSLCISLTSPATLEHLKFHFTFRGDSNYFNHNRFYEDLRDADVWRHLDSIITHPTGSRLQRVDLVISYTFRYDPYNDEILESILDALPLLREKGILLSKGQDMAWIAEHL